MLLKKPFPASFTKQRATVREKKEAMANQGDLWDDSILTRAFDDAISKYKKMHVKGYGESSLASGETKPEEIIQEASSSVGIDGDTSSQTVDKAELKKEDLPSAVENETLDSHVPQEYVQVQNDVPLQGITQTYPSSQVQEEYDQLCKEYYELEEKRGKIWEKLQQYGHSDYSYPDGTSGSCMQWPATYASQNQNYTSQGCYPALAITCCPNICSKTSCSLPICALESTCPCTISLPTMGSERVTEDADIIKKGMEAAHKAMSVLKEDASGCQLDVQSRSQKEQTSTGETDITQVLNAWYSAGFYTGKYLTEKSLAKPKTG